jgi:hypothetical protein
MNLSLKHLRARCRRCLEKALLPIVKNRKRAKHLANRII